MAEVRNGNGDNDDGDDRANDVVHGGDCGGGAAYIWCFCDTATANISYVPRQSIRTERATCARRIMATRGRAPSPHGKGMKYWPAATDTSPYEAMAGSQASSQDRLLVQSYLSNPRRRIIVASSGHHRIRLESETNPDTIPRGPAANPHPTHMAENPRNK